MDGFDDSAAVDGHNRKIRPTIYKTFLKTKSTENNSKVSS